MTGHGTSLVPPSFVPRSWAPTADPAVLEQVALRCAAAGLEVHRDRRLASLTTLRLGGPAAVFVPLPQLSDVTSLARALERTTAAEVPMLVLGKGSNTLIADDGFAGLVIKLGAGLKWLRRSGTEVEAGAGEAMPAVAAWVAQEGLAGLEFAAGIPATVGGSVRMNAGAHGGDMAGLLKSVDLVEPGSGELVTVAADALEFGYRSSALPERAIVVSACWSLRGDDPAAIRDRLDQLRAWRRAAQPLRERNCGSVFVNPAHCSAGELVDNAGLKGRRIGGARVSEKHANFIVVDDAARAADVFELISLARAAVYASSGTLLEPEVRLVGRF